MDTIRGVVLRGEAVARVREAGGPLADAPEVLEALKSVAVVAVERNGQIVAYWPLWLAVHAEPLWTHPDARGAGTIRCLVQTLRETLEAEGVPSAFAIIGYGDQAGSLPPALRLGFQRVLGDLYHLDLRARGEESDHGRSRDAGDQSGNAALCEPPCEPGAG